jgi:predicted transcriptional regulator
VPSLGFSSNIKDRTMQGLEKSDSSDLLIELTAEIVAAYVSNNSVAANDLPGVIAQVHAALGSSIAPAQEVIEKPKPAVSVRRSIQNDHLICLGDGQKYKSLKRHLMTHHGLTPEQYREKWDLPADYPMVAPSYAEARSQLAKDMGLGQKRKRGK